MNRHMLRAEINSLAKGSSHGRTHLALTAFIFVTAAIALFSLDASAASPVAQLAGQMPMQQQLMRHDPRDLSRLPGNPREEYYGNGVTGSIPTAPIILPSDKRSTTAKKSPKANATGPTTSTVSTNVSSAPDSRSGFQKLVDSTDFNYGMFLNGPSVGSDWGTSYSPFQQGTWPIYIYHTIDLQVHLDRYNLIGAEVSAHQDIMSGVTPSGFISPVDPKFDFNDPQFWFSHRGLFSTDTFSTDIQLSVFPAVTSYSVNLMDEYLAAAFDTTWNLKLRDRRWTTYFTTRVRPTAYGDIQPGDGFHREWMFLSAGYYFGYTLSQNWQVNLSGVFDTNMYADNNAMWNHGDGTDDRAQLEVNYYAGRVARIGAYFQTVVTNLSLVSSVVGLDVTVNFLVAK